MPSAPQLVCALLLAGTSILPAQRVVTLGSSKDNTLYEDTLGALSNGAGTHFFSGLTAASVRHRGLIAFDVASQIPAGSLILGVDLTLTVSQTSSATVLMELHAVSADWGEGTSAAGGGEGGGAAATPGDATWLHRFYPATSWSNAGGDFASAPSGNTSVASLGTYTWTSTAQMVADVQRWLDNPTQSFGWLLLTTETMMSSKRFDTKENPTPAARPRLVVKYVPKAGVVATGAGCAGGGTNKLVHAAIGLPSLGNASFALSVTGGPANANGALVFAAGLAGTPIVVNVLNPSCLLYLDPQALLLSIPTTLSGAGAATYPLPVPSSLALAGAAVVTQVGGADQGAPGNLIVSNALTSKPGN